MVLSDIGLTAQGVTLIGQLLQITALAGTAIVLGTKIGRSVGQAVERFEQVGKQQGNEITELKNEVKLLGEIMIKIAIQREQISNVEIRTGALERRFEELTEKLNAGFTQLNDRIQEHALARRN